jgi:hypothetical protein
MKGDQAMKMRFVVLFLTLWAGTAFAGPPSMMGGSPIPEGTVHHVGVGWPSFYYEWWHSGTMEWAIGGEVVYGDWSGEFSDVKIGGAFNGTLRWCLSEGGGADAAIQIKPGMLLGSMDAGHDDRFVLGLRGEVGFPVTIDLTPKVNLITGGAIPFSVFFVEDADDYVVLPLLARLGVEVKATDTITPWLLFEMGPGLAFGDFGTEAEFAFRIWVGSAFW